MEHKPESKANEQDELSEHQDADQEFVQQDLNKQTDFHNARDGHDVRKRDDHEVFIPPELDKAVDDFWQEVSKPAPEWEYSDQFKASTASAAHPEHAADLKMNDGAEFEEVEQVDQIDKTDQVDQTAEEEDLSNDAGKSFWGELSEKPKRLSSMDDENDLQIHDIVPEQVDREDEEYEPEFEAEQSFEVGTEHEIGDGQGIAAVSPFEQELSLPKIKYASATVDDLSTFTVEETIKYSQNRQDADEAYERNQPPLLPPEIEERIRSKLDEPVDELPSAELSEMVEQLCQSKADEFALVGYDQVTAKEVWKCVSSSYQKGEPNIHEVVNDVLSLKMTKFMNWVTINGYKGIT